VKLEELMSDDIIGVSQLYTIFVRVVFLLFCFFGWPSI
jgi:hypothetical protein